MIPCNWHKHLTNHAKHPTHWRNLHKKIGQHSKNIHVECHWQLRGCLNQTMIWLKNVCSQTDFCLGIMVPYDSQNTCFELYHSSDWQCKDYKGQPKNILFTHTSKKHAEGNIRKYGINKYRVLMKRPLVVLVFPHYGYTKDGLYHSANEFLQLKKDHVSNLCDELMKYSIYIDGFVGCRECELALFQGSFNKIECFQIMSSQSSQSSHSDKYID